MNPEPDYGAVPRNRAHIRVTMMGKAAQHELLVDGYKKCDVSRLDILDLISHAVQAIRENRPMVLEGEEMDFLDTIKFIGQAASSLHWGERF